MGTDDERISKFTILYELLLLKQPQLDNVADGLWMSFDESTLYAY